MTILRLITALAAVSFGAAACTRNKQPLFFKILVFGCASYLLGAVFEACCLLVYHFPPAGFHIGYLGYVGAYFFLLSSYFGAIDRLADGGEKIYRPYRLFALTAPLTVAVLSLISIQQSGWIPALPLLLMTIPVGLTLYFALKHLILPDVEMGIIRVMRPYNACIIMLCFCQILGELPWLPAWAKSSATGACCILLIVLLPIAERGVRKWFI